MISFLSLAEALASVSLTSILLVVSFVFIKKRGGYFVFVNYLWSFFNKENFHNDFLERERKTSLDIERFRVMYGIKGIGSLVEVSRAIKWSYRLSVPLRDLGGAGKWVDWGAQKLKKPSYLVVMFMSFIAILMLYLSVFTMVFTVSSEAPVQFKESRVWAWQGSEGFREFSFFNGSGWVINESGCEDRDSINSNLEPGEVDFACGFIKSDRYYYSFVDGVFFKRIMGFSLLACLVFGFYFSWQSFLASSMAVRVCNSVGTRK